MTDLVVAGGGPAGLVSALYAVRAGLSVTVLDRRCGPIDKACGEGLMPGAVRALHELGVDPCGHPISGITYLEGTTGRSAEAPFRHGPGMGVRRTTLQLALAQAAEVAGVHLARATAGNVSQSGTGVRVECDTGVVQGRYLIAADGLHSPLRRRLGLDAPERGRRRWGIRAHFAVAPWNDHVEVHWGRAGEAYVTPVAPDLVGVAVLTSEQGDYRSALREFPQLAARLDAHQPLGTRGAGPLRQRARSRVAGRVLLVGDAAGYVDALTGEGLAVAFAGARAAIDAIAADDPGAYERAYRRVNRRPQLITQATLWAAQHDRMRRRIVPAAARAPVLFGLTVNKLAR